MTLFSRHLFADSEFKGVSYNNVNEIVTVWLDDGTAREMIYNPAREIQGWSRIDFTGGTLINAVDTFTGDTYYIVKRTINGNTAKYIEIAKEGVDVLTDSAIKCSPTTTLCPTASRVGGLWHLEGETVNIKHNGFMLPDAVVTNGEITIDVTSSHTL